MIRALLVFLCLSSPVFAAPSMYAQDWTVRYSVGMPLHPYKHPLGGWFFKFPAYPPSLLPCANEACPAVHYITVPIGSLAGFTRVVFAGRVEKITGTLQFRFETETFNTPAQGCAAPAAVRLFFQRRGDTLSGNGIYEDFRWWSNPLNVELQHGKFRISVPLAPSQWSNVRGHFGNQSSQRVTAFQAALLNATNIGMTFGGGCSFGHGVLTTNGTARFTTTIFRLQ